MSKVLTPNYNMQPTSEECLDRKTHLKTLWHPNVLDQFQRLWSVDSIPSVICLDLDGTLVDSVPDLATAVNHMLVTLGRSSISQELVSTYVGNGADMLVRRALAQGNEQIAVAMQSDLVAEARVKFDQAYLACLDQATGIYPGVSDFLQRLDQAGCTLALITNKPRLFTIPLIHSLKWQAYFPLILCGDDLVEKKPSGLPIKHAMSRLNAEPNQTLMIGDSVSDFKSAENAGVMSVAVTYGYNHGSSITTNDGDIQVDSLMDLLND